MDDVIASLVKFLAQFKGVDKVVLIFLHEKFTPKLFDARFDL